MKNREILKFIAGFLLGFYKAHISPLLGSACRFHPTCSCYAQEAFQRFPPGYALFLTARRFIRCHPFGSYGEDPVPQNLIHQEFHLE